MSAAKQPSLTRRVSALERRVGGPPSVIPLGRTRLSLGERVTVLEGLVSDAEEALEDVRARISHVEAIAAPKTPPPRPKLIRGGRDA